MDIEWILRIAIWIGYFISIYILIYWLYVFYERKDDYKKERVRPIKITRYPLVSIIIPVWNEEKTLERTLTSLKRLDYPKKKLEVLVMNDGSTDNTLKIAEGFAKRNREMIIRIFSQKNRGKANALNRGVKLSKGELVACVDADSYVERTALKQMVMGFENDPDLAVQTPVMKVDNPKTYWQKFQRLEYMVSMLIAKMMSYVNTNYVAPGPFSIYRKKVLNKLGEFDGSYNLEDQEMAYRAQKHNYKLKQCANAMVYTTAPPNTRLLIAQRTRWFRGSLLNIIKYKKLFLNRNYGDFGVFQIPVNLAFFLLGAIGISAFAYYGIRPLVKQFYYYYLVGFDIMPFLRNIQLNFDILNVNASSSIIIGLMLVLTFVFLYYSSRMTDEKVRSYGVLYIIPYLLFYFLFMSFIMVKSVFEVLFRVNQKWR
jgi:cellulose synthase/poly-beta-1,6-N-acetylglucosamine synthase-like glycosyltransferase